MQESEGTLSRGRSTGDVSFAILCSLAGNRADRNHFLCPSSSLPESKLCPPQALTTPCSTWATTGWDKGPKPHHMCPMDEQQLSQTSGMSPEFPRQQAHEPTWWMPTEQLTVMDREDCISGLPGTAPTQNISFKTNGDSHFLQYMWESSERQAKWGDTGICSNPNNKANPYKKTLIKRR